MSDHSGDPVPSESNISTGAPDAPSLLRQIAELKLKVELLRGLQSRARRQSLLLVFVALVAIAVFVISTRSRIQENFSDQQVAEAVERQVPILMQEMLPHVRRVIADVGPDVRRQAMARLRKIGPPLADKSYLRLSSMPDTLALIMTHAMQTAFDRAVLRAEPELKKSGGTLGDAQKADLLLTHFHQQVQDFTPELVKHTQILFSAQTDHFRQMLPKFDLPNPDDKQDVDLVERDFLHHLLMVIDQNVQPGPGADQANVAPNPPGAPSAALP